MAPFAITLTIENEAKNANHHTIYTNEQKDIILFSVQEHLNWYAINDLSAKTFSDKVTISLANNFEQFSLNVYDMSITQSIPKQLVPPEGSRPKQNNIEIMDKNQTIIETIFLCEVILVDVNSRRYIEEYKNILSNYLTDAFTRESARNFFELMRKRDEHWKNLISVTSEVVSRNRVEEIESSPKNSNGNNFWNRWFGGDPFKQYLFIGCVGGGILITILSLIVIRHKLQVRYRNELFYEEHTMMSIPYNTENLRRVDSDGIVVYVDDAPSYYTS